MKTFRIILVLGIVILLSYDASAQIKVHSTGKVSVGTTTSPSENVIIEGPVLFDNPYAGGYNIQFQSMYQDPVLRPSYNGKGYIGEGSQQFYKAYINYIYYKYSCTQYSDESIKKNITPLDQEEAYSKILMLNAKRYDLDFGDGNEEEGKDKTGLLAQEVQLVIPEVVSLDTASGLLGIDYIGIIPYLIEAIKEQNEKIELLEAELENSETLELQTKSITGNESSTAVFDSEIQPFLGNNIPNPFDQNTEIEFYLPQEISNADFYIYDLQGKQIRKMNIVEREYGSIVIEGSQLTPGMYYYSLIADNQVIGTKQMILTD